MEKQDKPFIWIWQKVPVSITKLHSKQLYSIRSSILKHRNKYWFDHSREAWLKELDTLIEKREQRQNISVMHKQIIDRRIKSAILQSNYLMKNIVESSEQTLSVKLR